MKVIQIFILIILTVSFTKLHATADLRDQLNKHLDFIEDKKINNTDELKYKRMNQHIDLYSLSETLGRESEGIIIRENQKTIELLNQRSKQLESNLSTTHSVNRPDTHFEVNYRIFIDTKNQIGHIGPFRSSDIIKHEVEVSDHSEHENFTLEIDDMLFDLYDIDHLPYLIGNVYLRKSSGELIFFGRAIIQKSKS